MKRTVLILAVLGLLIAPLTLEAVPKRGNHGVEEPTIDQRFQALWKEISRLEKRVEKLEKK